MHTEVEVPNPNYELVPGMYASVVIPVHTAGNALAVPVQAVQATGDGRGVVLVVNSNNKIERRTVAVGIQTATDAEILSGLKESELVIFGTQGQYQMGEVVAPKVVNPSEVE
jgi:membrane fusion protein (multidrug efflux system)